MCPRRVLYQKKIMSGCLTLSWTPLMKGDEMEGLQMHKNIRCIALVVFVFLISGCTSTTQYQKFAKAETIYTAAADALLITTRDIGVNASSEALLKDDKTLYEQLNKGDINTDKQLQISKKIYTDTLESDKYLVEVIIKLRKHNRLLEQYFYNLNKLALSDSSDTYSNQIGGIVTQINKIGGSLRQSDFISNQNEITALSKVVIGLAIRGKLRDEFEKNQLLIDKELKTQELMLSGLSKFLINELEDFASRREERLVRKPFLETKPISLEDSEEWIKNRRDVLTVKAVVAELTTAKLLAAKLREAFDEIVNQRTI